MKKFTGLRLHSLVWNTGLVKLGLMLLVAAGFAGSAKAQPVNDNFANAIIITGITGTTNGSNLLATKEPGEPSPILTNPGGASVWYQWTAPTDGLAVFNTVGSDFDTILGVFTGASVATLTRLVGNDDTVGLTSQVSFPVTAGTTYQIDVAGYFGFSGASQGNIILNWNVSVPPPNDNFANAITLTGEWGSTNVDGSAATHELNEPNHGGSSANASVWYRWTAPIDGEITLDTLGSSNNVDTVLAVYTGATLATLNQVAANDDLFPISGSQGQRNISTSDYLTESSGQTTFSYTNLFYGPSGLRFNAKGGTTYYFAVDVKSGSSSKGPVSLNWAYKSSGVFRFASEDKDYLTGMMLYQCAETESALPTGLNNSANSAILTYYQYNVPGVLVNVTRVAGSTGRVTVNYSTQDGTALTTLPPNNVPGIAGLDYVPVSGTLVFDDFEMSKSILIPIINRGLTANDQTNRVFAITLTNAQPDYLESPQVSQPRVDPQFGTAMVRILNVYADPYGPNFLPLYITNQVIVIDTNTMVAVTNQVVDTNYVTALYPTNATFNFQKANYRVPADVNDPSNPDGWTTVTLWVQRFGTNREAVTLNYRVNNFAGSDANASEEDNAYFPLQPGSDYAVPTPATANVFRGTNSDFNLAQGTISFPGNGNGFFYQPITFTVPTSTLTKFNRDFRIQLYRNKSIGGNTVPVLNGMVAETTVTILFDDQRPPAGSVDQLYNADFNSRLALPPDLIPQTFPQNNLHNPGVSGQIYSLAVLTNDETLAVGSFGTYNGYIANNGIGLNNLALLKTDGSLDTSFNPGLGSDAAINSVAVAGTQFVIGGSFTAYDGNGCGHYARLNADGSMDFSFSTSQGSGADGLVRAVAVQQDGKVLIGGEFQHVHGVNRKYVARLNADGSLDATFNPGNTLSGPVYALALPPTTVLNLNRTALGGPEEDVQMVNLGSVTGGTLTINYDFLAVPDQMRVFYGNTNIAAGTGVLIYDTGSTNGAGTLVIPIGPTGGITTNLVTIVMNQGGSTNGGTAWFYNASVTVAQSNKGIMVGGEFNVSGQSYANVARLNDTNGLLDTTFNPGTGPDNKVLSLGWQLNDQIVAGGVFTHVNGSTFNHIVRFNKTGSVDTTNFFVGTGADNVVYSVSPQLVDGTIYVGGAFASFNGTHRLGFARLFANGTVDTSFLDTAYNQFAGLKHVYSYDAPAVFTSGVQGDGNVMIGGSFGQVGGGQVDTNVWNTFDDELSFNYGMPVAQSFNDLNLWTEPKARDGVRNRSSIARLIGGATPGPGNLGMKLNSYSQNKSQSSIPVDLIRTNGTLGPVSANFTVQPGLAQSGVDYVYNHTPPLYWIAWEYLTQPTRVHRDGLSGINNFLVDPFGLHLNNADLPINSLSGVTVSVIKNPATVGNVSAQFQLANPSGADQFYLGGQNIPLGTALGISSAPFTIIDDTQQPGTFGFSSSVFVATNLASAISVLRSNGVFGNISMKYSTTDGTAVVGTDYVGATNQNLLFNQNVVSNGFVVTIKNNGLIYTNIAEKTVNLRLSNLGNTPPGALFGISNAVLRIINPNFQGYLTLSTNNFSSPMSSGFITFIVNRVAGSLGSLSVQYATINGTALNGVDYIGATNTLNWNNGDISPKTVTLALKNTGLVAGDKQFAVSLFNPRLNGASAPSLMMSGVISNATLTINNDNSYGSLQFNASSYLVNENGGSATITVVRNGGAVGSASVNFKTSDGLNALAGVNYVATNGILNFTSNQLSASFNVQILNDNADDPTNNFYFNVWLTNSVNASLGTLTNAQVNILDVNHFIRPPGSPDSDFSTFGMNGNVFSLALQADGKILAGGNFTAVGAVGRGGIARLNTDGSLDLNFLNGLPAASGAVLSILAQTDGRVLVGGSFTSINNVNRRFIARLMTDGSLDTSFNPGLGADNVVNALAEAFIGGTRKIYVGGAFSTVSGINSPGFARLNNDGSADTSFVTGAGADGAVNAIAVYPTNSLYAGKVLIGGSFTHFNGTSLNYLARLNADGSLDTNFNANFGTGADGLVRALAFQLDGGVLVGGSFTNFNGSVAKRIIRLNANGILDTNFVSEANDSVETIAIQSDNRIVLGGQFTLANNVTRNHITRLLPSGAVDPTINFGDGANGDIDAIVVQPTDGMIVIGGAFSEYNSQPHANIARIYGGSVTGSGAFEFTTGEYQVDETGVFAPITIRRTGGTSGTNSDGSGSVLVNFATSDNTAVAGINYIATNTTVDFPAGEVLRQIVIPVIDDFAITPDLIVDLTLSPVPPAGIGNQTTAHLTIVNHDSAVCFSNAFPQVTKNTPNGVATIYIIRQGGTSGSCSVDFYTTTNGTAIIGTDYLPTNNTIVFSPGQTQAAIQVPIINNNLPEGNTTVGLILTNAVDTLLFAPSNATLTILDTTPAPGQLSFSTTNYIGDEGNATVNLTVLRTNGTSGSISVTYNTIPGTALPSINYVSTTGSLTFANGETSKNISILLVNNNLVQGDVGFSVTLSNPTGGASLIDPTNAAVTIHDNEIGIGFVNATNYVSETNSIGSILVQRIGMTNVVVAADYFTTNGTAFAGTNYTAIAGTLTFNPGETLKAITLPLLYDPRVTGNLNMGMGLTNFTGGARPLFSSNTVVIVQDGDAGLSFTNSAMSVAKNSGSAVITVICSNTNAEPVSVNYATAPGSALANIHYVPVTGTLTFSNGLVTNYFVVPIINNGIIESNRSFTVSLLNPTAPGQVTPPGVQTVTILEANSGFKFTSPAYTVLRSGITASITVLRSGNVDTTATVYFSATNGTAINGLDYISTNGVLVFTNGVISRTFQVPVIGNTVVQPDKTVLLQLFNPSNGVLSAPSAATLTIHDTSGSLVVPAGSTLTHEGFAPANGIIDPGENVTLLFALRASGGTNIPNVTATLLVTNGITSPSPVSQNYGALVVNGPSVSRSFSFTAIGTNSQPIAATFQIGNGITNIGTAIFTYTLGTWTTIFSNTAAITINDNAAANPYPSLINVTGVGGSLIKASVIFTNMSHKAPGDIVALLVSPSERDTILMGQAGGTFNISHVTLTFDDAATNSLPQNGQIVSGTNKPTNFAPPLIKFP